MEDISPGLEEDLPPEVDHRQVPVGVPGEDNDKVLEGPAERSHLTMFSSALSLLDRNARNKPLIPALLA